MNTNMNSTADLLSALGPRHLQRRDRPDLYIKTLFGHDAKKI